MCDCQEAPALRAAAALIYLRVRPNHPHQAVSQDGHPRGTVPLSSEDHIRFYGEWTFLTLPALPTTTPSRSKGAEMR